MCKMFCIYLSTFVIQICLHTRYPNSNRPCLSDIMLVAVCITASKERLQYWVKLYNFQICIAICKAVVPCQGEPWIKQWLNNSGLRFKPQKKQSQMLPESYAQHWEIKSFLCYDKSNATLIQWLQPSSCNMYNLYNFLSAQTFFNSTNDEIWVFV